MATFQFKNGKLIRTETQPRNGYDLALRMIEGKMRLVKVRDAEGHEHASDTGQFTSGSGGGSGAGDEGGDSGDKPKDKPGKKPGKDKPKGKPKAKPKGKPKHGERHAALKEQHEAFKKQRQEHFSAIKEEATAAKEKADEHWAEIGEHVDNIAAVHGVDDQDEANAALADAYNELEELKGNEPDTAAEQFQHFKDVEEAAKQLLEANKAIEPGTGENELAADDLAENKKRAQAIIASCKSGREQLRAYANHRREMKEIKELR